MHIKAFKKRMFHLLEQPVIEHHRGVQSKKSLTI
ncbi:hypothetical protein NC652_036619 [Populus alba x Populus x berolinensis]|uniref:Uncharacterized protein n=1 Tax=Populus alba x Populus x berolinensis TaxID=444605 RepID=A0AAD6LLF9_9ROSI|nr:hypothetical protein NC652_036619 [Populus alba x Populus x berolinensis]KAJ6968534.1 hypothetical protein NC653_036498 [Populus alba x Populus x berolinensis]